MSLSAGQWSWLGLMRDEWFRVMGRPRSREAQDTFPPLPRLEPVHVSNARVVASRRDLLRLLPKSAKVAEIGTYEGDSALEIMDACSPTEMHLFDLTFAPFRAAVGELGSRRFVLHEGDSSVRLAELPERYFSWIYIDGDHSYEGVRKDIAVARRKVQDDGMLVFNDYIYWSYLDQFPYGVPRAVNELCVDDGWEIAFFVFHERMYCDVALRRRA